MKLTVTGFLRGKNKDGRNFVVIQGTTPFSKYESDNNEVEGVKAISVYTSLDCDILTVGDVIDLHYEPGFQGQAQLVGFDMVSPFKDKPDAVKK